MKTSNIKSVNSLLKIALIPLISTCLLAPANAARFSKTIEAQPIADPVKVTSDQITAVIPVAKPTEFQIADQLTGELIELDPGVVKDPGSWLDLFNQPQYVEARINNNAQAVTEDLVPLLVSTVGLDDINIADQQLESGTLPGAVTWALACHNTSAVWRLNMNDIEVNFPVDSQTITAAFRDNKRINTDIDEVAFDMEFEMQFSYPKNVGGFYCSWGGHDINLRVNVNVQGIAGEFDVSLENQSGSRVQIDDIRKFEVEADQVSFDSGFLTSLTNMGITVAHLFGASCTTLTDCVNQAVNNTLANNNSIKNKLKDAINEALDMSLTIEGGTNVGAAGLDYSVALNSLETSNALDRLNTKWQVDFSGASPATDCTDGLSRRLFLANNNLSTDDDFDVVFPYRVITDLLYTVTRQLEPCVNFVWQGMPGGDGEMEIRPSGSFNIESVSHNELMVSLPVIAEAINFAYAEGTVRAEAQLTVNITPACGAGFELAVTDIALTNISGSITWSLFGFEYEMDAATFLTDAANDVSDDLMSHFEDPIILLPESFGLNGLDQYVSIGDVVSNSSAIAVGLNVTSTDPNCY